MNVKNKKRLVIFLIIISFILIVYCSIKIVKSINNSLNENDIKKIVFVDSIYRDITDIINKESFIYENENNLPKMYKFNELSYYKIENIEIIDELFNELGRESLFKELNIIMFDEDYYIKDYSEVFDNIYSGYKINKVDLKLNYEEYNINEYYCNGTFNYDDYSCDGTLSIKKYQLNLRKEKDKWLIDKYALIS